MAQSERFAGFSGGEKGQSEPEKGLFYTRKSMVMLTGSGIYCQTISLIEDWSMIEATNSMKEYCTSVQLISLREKTMKASG
jgi:hypothetical protein